MRLNKRGLSDVVTTGLIILLAIAAVIIVWSFIRPAITNVGESINTACINLELTPTTCSISGNTVTVKLGSGNQALLGVKLVYYEANGNSRAFDGVGTIPGPLESTVLGVQNGLPAGFTPVKVKVAGVVDISGKANTCPESVSEVACT